MMTMLTGFEPLQDMALFQNRLQRMFREKSGLWSPESGAAEETAVPAFAPPVDIYEDEHNIVLKVEVPGMVEKDIDVRLEHNTLNITGERKFEQHEQRENFQRVERNYGSFSRSFTLPTTVDTEKVAADYVSGVLRVTLPKKAEAKPKQIQIAVGSAKVVDVASTGRENGNVA